MKRIFFLVAVALLVTVGPASAVVVIDFGTAQGTGGTITVSGSNASGSGIAVGRLTVSGVSATVDGTYDTFGTGGDAFYGNGSAVLSFNTATNFISIVGGVCALGQAGCTPPSNTLVGSTTLLSGTFSTFNVAFLGSTLVNVTGEGPDTKSPNLLAALGLPTNTPFKFFALNIAGTLASGSTYNANSTDIENEAVPEPLSILLLGTVLVGVSQVLRRRANA